ncbi:MAG TPA: preprotein translocase subunit SecD [Mycobacterium sp.]
MALQRASAVTARLVGVILLGAVTGGCHPAQHAAPATSATPTPAPPPRAVTIQPLPVRPVQKSQPTTPDKCPAANPNAPISSANVLIACDLARATLYTLGPENMQLVLTQVDPPKLLTADFYEVNLRMNPSSANAWASFTAEHPHAHIAFIRDDLVLEAPIIEALVTSGQVALTTQTARAADQLAQLAGRPA